jgi:hypothetical protein
MSESKLELRFWQFHQSHPQVFRLLAEKGRQMLAAGQTHLSAKHLFEAIRCEASLRTIGAGFKLNNNQTAYYARLLTTQFPEFAGRFRFRTQRVQATFGPSNATLPSGEHCNN